MRQKVLARRLESRIQAMNTATMIWGTEESRKIEKVLRRAIQKVGCWTTST